MPSHFGMGRAFRPAELSLISDVYDKIVAQPWFAAGPERCDQLARYVFRMYVRGMVLPSMLEEICTISARKHFSRITEPLRSFQGRRVLLVEDDYFLASDAASKLSGLGAEVVGPVATVAEALDLIENSLTDVDFAVLDINLAGHSVFPVAGFLKMKQIPFVFLTGNIDRSIPLAFRTTPRFNKPADWKNIADQMASIPPISIQ